MIVLDLFCGTKSVANAFEERGHKVYTVDWDKRFDPDLCADIGTLTAADIISLCGGVPDVIWASPDCTTYSVAAISKHRHREANGNLAPVTDYALQCDLINAHLVDLIAALNPKYWFIETLSALYEKRTLCKGCQGIPLLTANTAKGGKSQRTFGLITPPHNLSQLVSAALPATTQHRGAQRQAHRA